MEFVQEMACLQGVGGTDWEKYKMSKVPDRKMRDFIGNS